MTEPEIPQPLVSIGVPVYNEEARLGAAVGELLRQTHANLEVIISDNASMDRTESVGRELAESDPRVRYVRQAQNLGAAGNFRFVLHEAEGDYFMWAAADDSREPTFVAENLARLLADDEAVMSISQVQWVVDGVPGGSAPGTAPLVGTARENVRDYLRTARDNSRFYGLFRRGVLVASYPNDDFFALDLATMLGTLRFGTHAELDRVLMRRGRNDAESYIHQVDVSNAPGFDRWFPMAPFTRYVVRQKTVPLSAAAIAMLTIRFAYEHLRYAAIQTSLYGRIAGLLRRLLIPLQRLVRGDR